MYAYMHPLQAQSSLCICSVSTGSSLFPCTSVEVNEGQVEDILYLSIQLD